AEELAVYKKILKEYSITFCDSEKSIYEELNKSNFNLILMDIGLAGSKDGIEMTKDLKANQKYFKIPVICITSHVFIKQKEIVKQAGAEDYLTKPLRKTELIEIIERYRSDSSNK
ncbi:MAG: hypothetical protein CVV24_10720, partial [Ignavibacteriae bacterium HGW-Ignavibacteriae-3]